MTRLHESDIHMISRKLYDYDKTLMAQTGKNLFEIGCYAMRRQPDLAKCKVAAIPITTGIGIISGFSQTVASIVRYLGAEAFTTEGTDVAGLEEAYAKEAQIIFTADDNTFGAFNVQTGIFSDNGSATGRGFAAALELATNKIDQPVLVLGVGPVGQAAAQYLSEKAFEVYVYDINWYKAEQLKTRLPNIHVLTQWQNKAWPYIIDATTAGNFIPPEAVYEGAIIAAPGMPLGVPKETADRCRQVIHNPLELGVAAMLCEVA